MLILISGDLGEKQYYGKIFIVNLISLLIGFLIADILGSYFLNEYLDDIKSSVLALSACIIILFIFSFIKSDFLHIESHWREDLNHLYVIHNSGLSLYDYIFSNEKLASIGLVGGGFIGIVTILKEITKGKKKLRTIDHGDRKLLFQWDDKEKIIFIMIISKDLMILREKLSLFSKLFIKKYNHLIEKFNGVVVNDYKDSVKLVEKLFR